MFHYIDSLFDDPLGTLMFFLLAFPARILALSAHEFAHAWVADKCGDPTARMMGRLTLNPLKHLDPLGTVMMLLLGFGWARPVPVNPRNYRDARRDDLLVSIAGVTMNLILFLLSFLLCAAVLFVFAPRMGGRAVAAGMLRYAPYFGAEDIAYLSGSRMLGYVYEMLSYFVIVNISLAIFNLLPVPPLDGYHVFNDLVLRRKNLFASGNVARAASGILMVLMFTGALGTILSYAVGGAMSGVGWVVQRLFFLFS